MYHIQDDKRAQKSAALILEAFQQCLQEKDYEAITITDLCRASTVSRATFYRLFDCKDDIVTWWTDQFFEHFCAQAQGRSIQEKLEAYMAAWMDAPDVLDLVIRVQRQGVPYASYRKRVDLLERQFMEMELSDYHVQILSSIITSLLAQWAQTGKKETPAEMVDVFFHVISDLHSRFMKQ